MSQIGRNRVSQPMGAARARIYLSLPCPPRLSRSSQPRPSCGEELYAPRPLVLTNEIAKRLLAFELADCNCPLPELPTDPDYEISIPEYRILVLAFQNRCHHVREKEKSLSQMTPATINRLLESFVRLSLTYDPSGYDPDIEWVDGPVWLDDGDGNQIDVSVGVAMASEKGWVEVYVARAAAGLPLFHPDDDNPRNRNSGIALQGVSGNRQGNVLSERNRCSNPQRKPDPIVGALDRLLARPAWWRDQQ